MIAFVKGCQRPDGGFGGNLGHDSHITTSLYALYVMAMFDAVDQINTDKLGEFMASLQ
jgi:geranylgeranyl transferase type-2 subunit beta